jgi:hypothetical protein
MNFVIHLAVRGRTYQGMVEHGFACGLWTKVSVGMRSTEERAPGVYRVNTTHYTYSARRVTCFACQRALPAYHQAREPH